MMRRRRRRRTRRCKDTEKEEEEEEEGAEEREGTERERGDGDESVREECVNVDPDGYVSRNELLDVFHGAAGGNRAQDFFIPAANSQHAAAGHGQHPEKTAQA
jgi:hypothetical protein